MKQSKIFFLTLAALLMLSLTFAFSGCVPPVPEVIEVTGVGIIEDDQSIKVDEILQLTAVVTPEDADNKAVTWESDNPDVATVDDNGLVTALKSGVVNITVTTEDNSFTDTVKITVTKPSPPPTPTIKKYRVNFQVTEAVAVGISRGIDLSGFKIEIFSDAEKTTKKTDTETDSEGKATVRLTNGEYWFSVTKDGYQDYPPENNLLSVSRPGLTDYFQVQGTDVTDIPPILMERVYTLTVDANPPEGGTANDETNTGPYRAGTMVDISAEAEEGYELVSWTTSSAGIFADETSTDTTFAMPADTATVTANFALIDYNLSLSVDPVNSGTTTGSGTYNMDDSVTLTATPATGYKFAYWTDNDSSDSIVSTNATYTFTMPPTDVNYTANFEVVLNGDFQACDFTGWTVILSKNYPQVQSSVDHPGTCFAYMGNGSWGLFDNITNTASIQQEVNIPLDAVNPVLEFYYLVNGTDEGGEGYDWMKAYINDVEVFYVWSDSSGWTEFQYDLSSYIGTTIELKISSWTKDQFHAVRYYINDITINWD